MKLLLTTVLVLLFLPGYGQPDSAPKASIHLVRSTGFTASMRKFKLFVDGNLACKIPNNRYLTLQLTPGQHSFAVQINGEKLTKHAKQLNMHLEPGKEYYLLTNLKLDAAGNIPFLNAVSLNNGVQNIPNLKEVACKK